jgi:hypothetical protein
MRLGLVGQVFGDEEVRDFLFLRGEGAELGDALELFGVRAGLGCGGASPVRCRVARVLKVMRPDSASCWRAVQVDSSRTWSLGMWPRQSVSWKRRETPAARVGSRRTVRRTGVASAGRMASWQ